MQIHAHPIPARRIIFSGLLFLGILAVGARIGSAFAADVVKQTDRNLDAQATAWRPFTEVATPGLPTPSWEINNVASPSLDGHSLRCAITGGYAYSNVHCYRNLDADPTSNTFLMSLSFYYRPRSTFNNQDGPSIVQALEFTMNKWHENQRYEWAVQWNNVGDGAPGWRYWDPHQPDGQEWVHLDIAGPRQILELEGERWHTLQLEGDILSGQVHYRRLTIDGHAYSLEDITLAPAPVDPPDDVNKLAVAVQLDGNNWNNTGQLSPYETFLDRVTFVHVDGTSIDHFIGSKLRGTFLLPLGASSRKSYPGLDSGPVKMTSARGVPVIAAERVIYKVNGVATSYSESMALPNRQLSKIYWLPWYNNKDLDTQLRFANVSASNATVHVYIGGQEMIGSPFILPAGASSRKSFPGIDKGPVKIVSNQNIVAAARVIYTFNAIPRSFSEMMALPASQLDNTYWLPWYNNKDLDTQLRFANVSNAEATVHVYIGGQEVTGSPFRLPVGASTRKSFPGIDRGPVKIESNQNIVAAERVVYKVNGIPTSYSEMMALPDSQVASSYWLPWYNNVELDTQLRLANLSQSTATVHVHIGGVAMAGSPFTLPAGGSTRKSFAGVNEGPVEIIGSQNIIVAERVLYRVNGVNTSFSELMGLPDHQLDTAYWIPWYNNVELDSQLRFGVPQR